MKSYKLTLCLLIVILCSCNNVNNTHVDIEKTEFQELNYNEQVSLIRKNLSKDSILSFDQEFIFKEILKEKYQVKIAQYLKQDCYPIQFSKDDEIQNFEGFQNIGDIDNDNKDDFVFILSPLNYCEEGQSYYFSNPDIERIITDSYCCRPNSIFSIGDMDEDGRNEIAQYYSSCASRYKAINIWTIKENKWKLVETLAFTVNNGKYEVFKDFDKLFKKVSKGIFQFLEISDVRADGQLITEWKTIKLE